MNVNKKRGVSCILILTSILLLVMITFYEHFLSCTMWGGMVHLVSGRDFETAASIEECVVVAETLQEKLEILPFRSADGTYYVVVPSMANDFYFVNLPKEWTLSIDGNDIVDNATKIKPGNVTIIINSNETIQVLHSQNISAMFLDVEVEQEVLDAEKGICYVGDCILVDSDGKTVLSETLEYISARGNTTFGCEKKPYNLKLKKEKNLVADCYDEKWVLLANAIDDSLLKNGVVYDFVNTYTELLTAEGDYVDLYINGDYRGNYYLCNRPQYLDTLLEYLELDDYEYLSEIGDGNDKIAYTSNVEGTAFGKLDEYSSIPGSECVYLVEFTVQDVSTEISGFYTKSGVWGRVVQPQNATLSQVQYIKDIFDRLEDIISDETVVEANDLEQIELYLDIDSYADRFLIDNVFQNHDSGLASSWFYKKPDYIDTKIYAGPIWDYDGTMHYLKEISEWDTSIIGNVYLSDKLLQYDSFVDYIKYKFEEVYEPYVKYVMPSKLYEINNQISCSRRTNNIRWNKNVLSDESIIDDLYKTSMERVSAIENRILSEDDYCNVVFYDYDMRIQCIEVVKRGEKLDNIPTSTAWIAVFNGWKSKLDGTRLTCDTCIWEDVEYVSEWIPIELIVQNGINRTGINIDSVDIDTLEKILNEIRQNREGGE